MTPLTAASARPVPVPANDALTSLMPDSVSLVALITAGSALALFVTAAVLGGGYLLTCRIWPFTSCPRCKGLGRLHQPGRKTTWRDCPRCRGTGRRLRIGRRLWNNAERQRRNAI